MQTRTQRLKKEHKKHRAIMWLLGSLLGMLVVLIFFTVWFKPIVVGNSSMYSTLKEGEVLLVDRLHKHVRTIQRGELVTYRDPASGELQIKRVIGMGGETIRAENDIIYINEEFRLEENYIVAAGISFSSVTIPEGTVFVLSDNRHYENGKISRSTECIRIEDIVGVVEIRLSPFSFFSTKVEKNTEY